VKREKERVTPEFGEGKEEKNSTPKFRALQTDERSNDRTNERSEFWQHNGRTKIIWKNDE
jgi:hypothetical protein